MRKHRQFLLELVTEMSCLGKDLGINGYRVMWLI
jgi:hypothetical protein